MIRTRTKVDRQRALAALRMAWACRTLCALASLLLAAASAHAQSLIDRLSSDRPITYHIADGTPDSMYRASDRQLAEWALEAWGRAVGGALEFIPAPEDEAILRIYFVPASAGQYGEMRPILVDGRRGAEVYVRPDTRALGPDIARAAESDPLLRETIVYLTCLHELGHALGLAHTSDYADIMYFFGYGGDIPAFFGRYREQLAAREDIANVSGLSEADVRRIEALYSNDKSR